MHKDVNNYVVHYMLAFWASVVQFKVEHKHNIRDETRKQISTVNEVASQKS